MYSSVTSIAEPVEKKTSVMKKIAVVGLFMGCMAMAFIAGTKYTQLNAVASSVNPEIPVDENGVMVSESEPYVPDPTDERDYKPQVPTGMLLGAPADEYMWIIANAKDAFQGILDDPNEAANWDTVAKAYCNVVKMYCAYVPKCSDDLGCRPEVIREEWNLFCKEGAEITVKVKTDATAAEFPDGKPTQKPGPSMKDKACKHLDYVNGPGLASR